MRQTFSRRLAKQFAWSLLLALTAGSVFTSAQTTSGERLRGPGRRPPSGGTAQTGSEAPAISGPTWNPTIPSTNDSDSYPARFWHSGVYDPESDRLIVFGGQDSNYVVQNTLLLLTQANGNGGTYAGQWSDLIVGYPTPPPRCSHTAVYDQANNRMIVFGGCADVACFIPLNDTWVLSDANGVGGTAAWTQLSPSGPLPSARSNHQAIYDAANNRMIVFGGYSTQSLTDVWALTNANGLGGTPAWIQLSPVGGPPDSLDGSSVVYDAANNIATVFGGWCVNSVWTLSHANGLGGTPAWTNVIPNGAAGSPGCRSSHSAVYDSANNRTIVYGGNSGLGIDNPDFDFVAYGDVWLLSNANGLGGSAVWTQLHPKAFQPVGRIGHSAFYDPVTNRVTIFAGFSIEGVFLTTWILYHANGL